MDAGTLISCTHPSPRRFGNTPSVLCPCFFFNACFRRDGSLKSLSLRGRNPLVCLIPASLEPRKEENPSQYIGSSSSWGGPTNRVFHKIWEACLGGFTEVMRNAAHERFGEICHTHAHTSRVPPTPALCITNVRITSKKKKKKKKTSKSSLF